LAELWELSLEEWLPGGRGACVLNGVAASGERVVLKIPASPSDTRSERAALQYWDGDGAPRLLGADDESGALLVEWVDGRPFGHLADSHGSFRRAGAYLRRLRRPRPGVRAALPTLEEKLAPLRRSRERAEGGRGASGLKESTIRREDAVRRWLADSTTKPDAVVLHGDLHAQNLLVRRDGALVAIDPYGVLGDPARDVACLALHFREDGKALDRIETLADYAEVSRERVLAHAYAIAVGAYRFRSAYGIADGRAFLQGVIGELERRPQVRALVTD
jgi:streptomycin 6-kinase